MTAVLRRYFRGRKLNTMEDVVAGKKYVFHFDHQGSTQALTDATTGAVTDRFASDAWGVPVKRTGTSPNHHWYVGGWGYSGGRNNRNYARNRHLNTAIGSWISQEPLLARPLWSYVENSPGWRIDPTGLTGIRPNWQRGHFRHDPPLIDPVTSTWNTVQPDALDAIKCGAGFDFVSLYLCHGKRCPVLNSMINHWIRGDGSRIHLPSNIMGALMNGIGFTHSFVCNRDARFAAQFAEKTLPQCMPGISGRLSEWTAIWNKGETGGAYSLAINNSDPDLFNAIGGVRTFGSAMVKCRCTPNGDLFTMRYTYRLVDQFIGTADGKALGYRCHLVGYTTDFLVLGTWNAREVIWRRNHFDDDVSEVCP